LVWADAADLLATVEPYETGASGAIKVTAGEDKAGNAVVAVKVGGEIKWSWHIWVTGYDPASENTTSQASGLTFMSRNLGAKAAGLSADAYGLYYQWGRKDPFPTTGTPGAAQAGGGSFTAIAKSDDTGTVLYSIQHPGEFITFNGDWLVTADDGLWGQGSTKSLYDPCPSGWRVPGFTTLNAAGSPWKGFTTANGPWDPTVGATGRDWSAAKYNNGESDVNLFVPQQHAAYPAAGYRALNTGTASTTGVNGFVWSTGISDITSSYQLWFSASVVLPANGHNRAYGFSVRCVKEQ
jgi:hypothetical protein